LIFTFELFSTASVFNLTSKVFSFIIGNKNKNKIILQINILLKIF